MDKEQLLKRIEEGESEEVELKESCSSNNKISETICAFANSDGGYIIFGVAKNQEIKIPNYPGVKEYFENNKIEKPNLKQIRDAIIHIRSTKLPDPQKIANAGSFFKNPIVSSD